MTDRLALLTLVLAACGKREVTYDLSREELLDPASCAGCHPKHFTEWSGSMHAYAAEDPVFRAMNARGQRETDGALGDFCVQCHAPVALQEGWTTDGLDLDDVPEEGRGVTCYFCHQVDAVEGDHNAQVRLADDGVLRGPIGDPLATTAHASAWGIHQDRARIESSAACGACHDVVTPAGVHLERTYLEWQQSQYSLEEAGLQQTCGSCHMAGRDGLAAQVDGAPERRVHAHTFEGVDLALTPWPESATQRELVQDALDSTVQLQLEVVDYGTGTAVTVYLDNVAAGHGFPSGAAHDRRVWVELVAYEADGSVAWSSGTVAADTPLRDAIEADPSLWWLGDRVLDADGHEAHMFWEVAEVESQQLPAPSRAAPGEPGYVFPHQSKTYELAGVTPTRIAAAVNVRALGLDVLQSLVDSGDLDPGYLSEVPTLTLEGSEVEWGAE